jgi:hypothetical protein
LLYYRFACAFIQAQKIGVSWRRGWKGSYTLRSHKTFDLVFGRVVKLFGGKSSADVSFLARHSSAPTIALSSAVWSEHFRTFVFVTNRICLEL